ncbi:MAG: efflux RND transporter periplasmic adaptor subunit [Vicinamibacterales bacterium]
MAKKRILAIVGILAVVVTASVTAYYRHAGTGSAPAVATATVSRGSVVEAVEATGTLEAVTTVEVGTQVSGTIKALAADYNSQVRKGQVIAQLEPSLFETQVEQARATLLRLQADVESAEVQVDDTRVKLRRAEELMAKQLIPAIDLETAQANARRADASLKGAEAQVVQGRAALRNNEVNLGHTTITAPIDGIVISRNVDVGQTVAASMSAPTLFVIAQDLKRMQVNASVDESDIGRIETGQRVAFRVDAYPEETFAGTVKQVRLAPVVEQNVVSYVTVIDVPNAGLKLKPGMTANVTIEIARADDVLRVPNAALRFRPTADTFTTLGQQVPEPRAAGGTEAPRGAQRPGSPREGLWVLSEGRIRRVAVQTGISDGTATAIAGGELREGAQVVTGTAFPAAARTQAPSSPLLPQRLGGSRGGQRGVR